ncbi:hypothetical protein HGR01_40220 (plasmid) [Tolypothrix sp. PCC 7712]|uniref:adenylate/guanylate cyclase domain-containing protein n=1 Tax=Tolypothrix sp. PCC 7712 TaxID=2596898 RepID=UPI0021F6B9A9|nr:adenylate/guanylate cyclase domain-containing protein [Tolypothrix sp. PCC 7712]UYD31078.1 hypothetical protein HGR01_40220 [Tolypothrix sp. PCC 7712]
MVLSKQAFSPFFDEKRDFISVAPSWQAFQALRGGKICLGYFYPNWLEKGLPENLNLRISLHAGPVYQYVNPVTKDTSYIGTHVSYAARIESITPPGKVYGSQAFAALACSLGVQDFSCDYVGQIPFAKGYGTFPTYHVRRQTSF